MIVLSIAERGESLKPLYWMAPETSWSSSGVLNKHTRVEDRVTTCHHQQIWKATVVPQLMSGFPTDQATDASVNRWAKRAHKAHELVVIFLGSTNLTNSLLGFLIYNF